MNLLQAYAFINVLQAIKFGSGHLISLSWHLPSITARAADGSALALGPHNFGSVRLGLAAKRRRDLGCASHNLGVVGLSLGDGGASLVVLWLGDGLVAGRNASLGGSERVGGGNDFGADLDVVDQNGAGNDCHRGGLCAYC